MRSRILTAVIALFLVFGMACSKKPAETTEEGQEPQEQATAKQEAPRAVVIPANTVITVRVGQTLGSKTSSAGEQFAASVARPVSVNGQTVIEEGASATGTVLEAVPQGRFKGGARLRVKLNSINIDGKDYRVQTSSVLRVMKGKGKRSAVMIGGGAGLGALIGGLAGGGKGAAIGAGAGAGAGTAGAAFTGNKEAVIAAESALSFTLQQPVQIK